MPDWVGLACADYTKRLPRRWRFAVREFAQAQGGSSEQIMARESDSLLSATPAKSHLVALDNRGSRWSTAQTADQLRAWQAMGKNVIFMIGGADGLHPDCRERADQLWSLSDLTFPHPLVRVILVEQLYRAQSLIDNHPYHRA